MKKLTFYIFQLILPIVSFSEYLRLFVHFTNDFDNCITDREVKYSLEPINKETTMNKSYHPKNVINGNLININGALWN